MRDRPVLPTSDWYLFKDIRRKPLQEAAWIPLRANEDYISEKTYGEVGYLLDTFACGSLAVPLEHRQLGDGLGWSEIGVGHETRSYADSNGYKPVDQYWRNWPSDEALGVELVIAQSFGWDDSVWHLNLDVVSALSLRQEGDVWVRPDEGYIEVARLSRSASGQPIRLEMRTEHLRDYLAARRMALRVAWYRDRDSVLRNADHIKWRDNPPSIDEPHFCFEAHCHDLHEGSGMPFGGQSAVFTVRRTDVYPEDDVPEFGPETDENVASESHTFGQTGAKVFRVEGEIWCEEWVEPATHSVRVRGDEVPSATTFIVDASGQTQTGDELDNEDIGKYLWFRPEVIPDLLKRRGAKWRWYTRETGAISLTHGYHVHFGINRLGLINAYAYDIGKLPEWQRRIWQGFNIPPEGGVSGELLAAQQSVAPANTHAPEAHLSPYLEAVNDQFQERFGVPLFSSHTSIADISASIHRFRALDQQGVFSLAKDISRLIVEAIDTSALHKIAPPPKAGVGTGSMKSLERVLATIASPTDARAALTYLVGIYELRGADAHLPSAELDKAFELAGVDKSEAPFRQGMQLLFRTMQTLSSLYVFLSSPAAGSADALVS
ncbi:hypothetical protein [uncultured Paracoccus sp.]|uniref:hypothetical protein n=1 Tax=uncultured Paracoccus sp. TaxID=189685 RepID=UPI0025976C88|nr:hypothetical protein [uncultured Paracoccus sp.]